MPSDPTRTAGPRYTPVQRRLLTALAGLVVAALAGAAYALTYDVLRDLARLGGVGRRWAPLYPAMADTLTALAILSLVITRNARWWTRLPRWTLLMALVAGGAALSVQDSVRGLGELPRDAVRAGVAVAPHVALVVAVWLWLTMVKQIRVARPAADDAPAAEPQRGHVKVLEPAAPEPLALEAPAEPRPEPLAFPDDDPEPLIPFPREEPAHAAEGDDPFDHGGFEYDRFEDEIFEDDDAPPLDTLPEPRPPLDRSDPPGAPALLPTDVELVRTRDRGGEAERPAASTTRPDIPMPGTRDAGENDPQDDPEDDGHPALRNGAPAEWTEPDRPHGDSSTDDQDAPPADRAEDPDAEDWNPPPSGSFRSGPTPPAG